MSRARPVVAISGYREEEASYRAWSQEATLLPWSYVRAARAAGAEPVVLPPGGEPDVLRRLDGLVLAGGIDIDARRYDEEPHPLNDRTQPERDESELRLLAVALDHGLPVLGVCRGMQLMALAYGGRLVQHLPDVLDTEVHQQQAGAFRHHDVDVLPGTLLADVYGPGRWEVPTYHHQGVAHPGSLTVAARAADGVVEALEDPVRPFVLGVQWHPEVLDDGRLFGRFVAAAAAARDGT